MRSPRGFATADGEPPLRRSVETSVQVPTRSWEVVVDGCCADADDPNQQHTREMTRAFDLRDMRGLLEVHLHADLCKARRYDQRWYQPRALGDVGLIVGQCGVGVQRVIQIEAHLGSHAPELQELRRPEVELVDAISIERSRR